MSDKWDALKQILAAANKEAEEAYYGPLRYPLRTGVINLEVMRFSSQGSSTLGILFDTTNGRRFLAFTLEDAYREQKLKHQTRIPKGRYQITLREVGGFNQRYLKKFGPEFHKGMLHVQDVPGFNYILIHCGNTKEDTSGCLLVGDQSHENVTKDGFIGSSVTAYKRIYPLLAEHLRSEGSVQITYIDHDDVLHM